MGVCLVAYAVSDAHIDELIADPPLIWQILEPDDDSAYLRELKAGAKVSRLASLLGRSKPEPVVRHLVFAEHELSLADLDKSWDGLRACLRICAPQAPDFFEGSGQIGKIEVGYGPALYLRSEEMSRIASAYDSLTPAQLLAAFRSADLSEVYPKGLWRKGDADVESYLTENLEELQAFVRHVREHSLGAVIQYT